MTNKGFNMSLEEYLRGKLNTPSNSGAPTSIMAEEYGDSIPPNLFANTKNRFAVLSNHTISKGINLEPDTVENFSIFPISYKDSPGYDGVIKLVREYYESQGMIYDEKTSTPSRNNPDPAIWFNSPEGKRFYVTYTPNILDKENMEMLFSASFCQF